jgi:D-lactate dehydrogenase (cytochrome)
MQTHEVGFLDDLDLAGSWSTGESHRRERSGDHGTDAADERLPDAVVWPASTADVSRVLAAADERGVPVTPYAAGSGLEGAATPVEAGICLDMTRMDAVVEVRPDDLQVDVEPGVVGDAVDEAVARHGLFFPPLPSSGAFSTVGGMIATDASGMKTVKYGEVADWVIGLEVVLADGTVLELGGRAVKTSSGYNLLDLVVGSEGTLAVVTRATLRLAGRPTQIRAGRAVFETLDDATGAVADAVAAGVDFATVELLDELTVAMANAYADVGLPDAPTLFFEFHANHGVDEEVEFCRTVFESHDAVSVEVSDDDERMAELWRARKDLDGAINDWDPDLEPVMPGDLTVPVSAYPDLLRRAKELTADRDLVVPCFGHAGDGNVHYSVLVDHDDPEQMAAAERVHEALVDAALSLGGTVTGEHGIGLGKREHMVDEHGPAGVALMRRIKHAFDPNGTLNPGKVFPTPDGDD